MITTIVVVLRETDQVGCHLSCLSYPKAVQSFPTSQIEGFKPLLKDRGIKVNDNWAGVHVWQAIIYETCHACAMDKMI